MVKLELTMSEYTDLMSILFLSSYLYREDHKPDLKEYGEKSNALIESIAKKAK